MNRRSFLEAMGASAAVLALPKGAGQQSSNLATVFTEVEKRHDEAIKRLQEWIHQPSIAAENNGVSEGCDLMIRLLRDAGFGTAVKIATDGQPGVFATLDAGARKTAGVYFMYDVKQVDPSEWSSPPWEARIIDKAGFGRVLVGRGAVNQKGPEAAFLAALHAFRGAGRKLPVNLVLVAEGEEEIGSPHFAQIVRRPEVASALAKASGVFMPSASQGADGVVQVSLGAKGVIELELVSTGEKWGRGPQRDIHSSNKARVDSPAWHLVQALHTLVTENGEPAVDGFADRARAISGAEKAMVAEGARRFDEAVLKKQLGVQKWINDAGFVESLERLVSRPTVNIEGLVGGYTGPGGKTILPHRAVAKLDLRLVPDMKASEALAALKNHLAKRGFGDIEVNMTGGYDPTSTEAEAPLIRAQVSVLRRAGIDPLMWPRNAGSWPGYVFTDEPLHLAAGHFGLGHGSGAHAPDEYYVIESTNPKIQGFDGAVKSFVEYLAELATI
ncbi:MAG TPA: M20/M25/M40 family metallo-hydrolase [Thermoanaerobaculia bacterium]|jgi:acetylornithine deacetylase/succinyl-diaminopimelate desuccinylase-like protein|nr:M20/M25/M40 family metallo-hydrolase [Thermoanaerobaculia bacterium]